MSARYFSRRALCLLPLVLATPLRAETPVVFHDGLVVRVPEGFEAMTDGDALAIAQVTPVRAPLTITLRVTADFELHPHWFARRHGDIRYTLRNLGGAGSGGPVHELRAIRDAEMPLAMIARRQAEGRPDFRIALDLLSSVHRPPH